MPIPSDEEACSAPGTGSGALLSAASAGGPLSFTCPRCKAVVDEHLYGPCTPCRAELRAELGRDAREVAFDEYEPKMNVTPNAVALKD